MSGNLQTPSGTGFDPSPQFWVDRVELDCPEPMVVIRRGFFGPITTGLVFDGVAPKRDGAWPLSDVVSCCLRVEEARIFGQVTDEVDQSLSARLVLSGQPPPCLADESVLVARVHSGEGWRLQGRLWAREAP